MAEFKYRCKGTNDDGWNTGTIEAENISAAEEELDKIFAVQRDENGEQTNSDMIQVEIINEDK
jgi:hypothetical protein